MSWKEIQQQRDTRPLHILITGSSQGIGLAAAQRLLSQGHVVYHACRTKERALEAAAAAGGGVALEGCDLADFDSIQRFAKDVHEKIPRLDVLCLNAGIAPSSSATRPPRLTAQGYEACIGINHLGHFLLFQLLQSKLLPNKKNSSESRGSRLVITASSVHDPEQKAGQSGGQTATLGDLRGLGINLRQEQHNAPTMVNGATDYHGGKVYKDSKLCNILMGRQAAKEFPSSDVTVVCFNPGFVPTTGLFDSLRKESWFKATALTIFANIMGFAIPLQVAGDRLAYLATTTDDIPNGSYFSAPAKCQGTTPETGFVLSAVSKEASDDAVAARLWEKSLEIVQPWL
jgi:light-dependent protochlorophyllide reductase